MKPEKLLFVMQRIMKKKTLANDISGTPDEVYDKPSGVHVWG